jgi:hypothetical protein
LDTGQPILRGREVPLKRARSRAVPEREAGQDSGAWMRILRGNATEGGDVGAGPGKSYLFFLTVHHPEIGLSGARVQRPVEPCNFAGSGAPATALENPPEGISFRARSYP